MQVRMEFPLILYPKLVVDKMNWTANKLGSYFEIPLTMLKFKLCCTLLRKMEVKYVPLRRRWVLHLRWDKTIQRQNFPREPCVRNRLYRRLEILSIPVLRQKDHNIRLVDHYPQNQPREFQTTIKKSTSSTQISQMKKWYSCLIR